MPPVAKGKKIGSNKEIENTSFDTLNYQEESINTYNTGGESEQESEFSTGKIDYDSPGFELFP